MKLPQQRNNKIPFYSVWTPPKSFVIPSNTHDILKRAMSFRGLNYTQTAKQAGCVKTQEAMPIESQRELENIPCPPEQILTT